MAFGARLNHVCIVGARRLASSVLPARRMDPNSPGSSSSDIRHCYQGIFSVVTSKARKMTRPVARLVIIELPKFGTII